MGRFAHHANGNVRCNNLSVIATNNFPTNGPNGSTTEAFYCDGHR